MLKVFILTLCLLCGLFSLLTSSAYAQIVQFSGAASASFTPQWETLRTGAGGQITSIAINSDGTTLIRDDTYGGYLYKTTGPCSGWGSTYPPPCWQQLVTSNSISGITVNAFAPGTVELIACNSNTNVGYMLWNGFLYVTTNLQSAPSHTWIKTTQTTTQNANSNGTKSQGPFLYCDPANPNIIYVSTPAGVKYSTNGLSGASATFASVTGIGLKAAVTQTSSPSIPTRLSSAVLRRISTSPSTGPAFITRPTAEPLAGDHSVDHRWTTAYDRMWAAKLQLLLSEGTSSAHKFGSGSWSSFSPGGAPAFLLLAI